MVQPLQRVKLGGGLALYFVVMNAFFIAPYMRGQAASPLGPLSISYIICISVAHLLAFFGALPLIYFWATGRFADELFLSSATECYSIVLLAVIALLLLTFCVQSTVFTIEFFPEKKRDVLFSQAIVHLIGGFFYFLGAVFMMVLVVREAKRLLAGECFRQPSPA